VSGLSFLVSQRESGCGAVSDETDKDLIVMFYVFFGASEDMETGVTWDSAKSSKERERERERQRERETKRKRERQREERRRTERRERKKERKGELPSLSCTDISTPARMRRDTNTDEPIEHLRTKRK
jgi:hypothetical protein